MFVHSLILSEYPWWDAFTCRYVLYTHRYDFHTHGSDVLPAGLFDLYCNKWYNLLKVMFCVLFPYFGTVLHLSSFGILQYRQTLVSMMINGGSKNLIILSEFLLGEWLQKKSFYYSPERKKFYANNMYHEVSNIVCF